MSRTANGDSSTASASADRSWAHLIPSEDFFEIAKAGDPVPYQQPSYESLIRAFLDERETQLSPTPPVTAAPAVHSNPINQLLLRGHRDIRLLELHAGNFEDEIRCTLSVYSVGLPDLRGFYALSLPSGRPVPYTAVSYAWGDPSFTQKIVCNGLPFRTTRNLESALRHIRSPEVAFVLWIDQICINQADSREKGHQVGLMRDIYKRASSTIVWLGEEADGSNNALELVKRISVSFLYMTDFTDPGPDGLDLPYLPAPGSRGWAELGSLLGRQWFQRLWIMQEVILSNAVNVLCGKRWISWYDLGMCATYMVDNNLTRYLVMDEHLKAAYPEAGYRRIGLIEQMKGQRHMSLLRCMVNGRNAQCSDARDKVYAIMGLTAHAIEPDYTISAIEVYQRAGLAVVKANYTLGMLCCVDYSRPLEGRPSWIPDWSAPARTVPLGYYRGLASGIYRAATGKRMEMNARVSEDIKSLSIAGMLFDTISDIGPIAESLSLEPFPYPSTSAAQFLTSSMHLAASCCPYPSGCNLFQAFWQTMVAGKDDSGFEKPSPSYADIFSLLLDTASGMSPSMPKQTYNPKRRLNLDNLKKRRPGVLFSQILIAFAAAVNGRRFGKTAKQYMGLLPAASRPGDLVYLIMGSCVPFVVRRQTDGCFQLVGECYIHGIMDGEAMQMEAMQRQDMVLI